MDNGIILKISDLTKEYKTVKAVDHISFTVNSGQIIGLLGPNGAGKTTTINMILGIVEPSYGDIEIFGENMKEHKSKISKNNIAINLTI